MSGIIENCKHLNTKIWEPHLAGARKCLSCDMVYNPNMGGWYVEEPSIETQLSNLKSKHERVLEMLKVCEDAINTIIDQGHLNRWEIHLLCLEAKDKIEELKK